MTRENFTSINVIIDKSGSMGHLTADTIGSFNTFLAEQKDVPGEAVFTLCTFNTDYSLVHDFIKLGEVPKLNSKTYKAHGGTALLDALGSTMESVGTKLAAMEESERPSKVIFLVITDGEENSSHVFTQEKIKEMVEHQRSVYNWEFVFMGANIDSVTTATNYGFSAQNAMDYEYSSRGIETTYKGISDSLRSYRGGESFTIPTKK